MKIVFAVAALGLALSSLACGHETPIQRAERICRKTEKAKIDSSSSDAVRKLGEMGIEVTCTAGPALCSVDENSDGCKAFIAKYN